MPNSPSEFCIEGKAYPLKIKDFKSSKSLKLRVIEGSIFLTKSPRTPIKEALKFLEENKSWLLAKLEEEKQSLSEFLSKLDAIYINKKPYKIILVKDSAKSCIINHSKQDLLFSYENDLDLKEILIELAKKILPTKTLETASSLGITHSKISVRSQRSRWGSCSSSGMLSLNWRLILLSEDLQNYIICHELAHIKFMDHSSAFWIYLSTLCPQAKKLDRQLGLVASKIFKLSSQ